MRRMALIAGLAALLPLASLALAANKNHDGCNQDSDVDLTIEACTQVIGDGDETLENHVIAYFKRGNAWVEKGEHDKAILDYTHTVRLDPKHSLAYSFRGGAWSDKGELDKAIADYTEAIRIDPDFPLFYEWRGQTWTSKGQYNEAIADHTKAIALHPKDGDFYKGRARALFFIGDFAKAAADFRAAENLDPKDLYATLWLQLANWRAGQVDYASSGVPVGLDLSKWPWPVLSMFNFSMTPEAVLAAADHPDQKTRNGQVCEANLYIAEFSKATGRKSAALPYYRAAVRDCPRDFVEYGAAVAALRAVGEMP